jgi:hypothetical protein
MSSGLDDLRSVARYAPKALSLNVRQRGPLPRHDLDDEDFVQEVYLALLDDSRKVSKAGLLRAVRRALCRVRSTLDKRKQRGLPAELTYDPNDIPQAALRTAYYTAEMVEMLGDFAESEREMMRQFANGDSLAQVAKAQGLTMREVKEIREDLIRRTGEALDLLGRSTI